MKSALIIVGMLIFVMCRIAISGEYGKQTIAVDNSYPPYMYGDYNHAKGLYPKLIQMVFDQMGTEVEINAVPWKRALAFGESGKWGIGGIYKNEERLKNFDFTDPFFEETLVMYVKKGNRFVFGNLSDLKNMRVGINSGWSYGDTFDQACRDNIILTDAAKDNSVNFKKLLLGRIDCMVVDEIAASQIIFQEDYAGKVEQLNKPITRTKAHVVFAKHLGRKGLTDQFNTALAKIKEDGTYHRILDGFIKDK